MSYTAMLLYHIVIGFHKSGVMVLHNLAMRSYGQVGTQENHFPHLLVALPMHIRPCGRFGRFRRIECFTCVVDCDAASIAHLVDEAGGRHGTSSGPLNHSS